MQPHGSFFVLDNRTTNILWLGLLGLVVIFFFARFSWLLLVAGEEPSAVEEVTF